jgi:Transposase DDE domain
MLGRPSGKRIRVLRAKFGSRSGEIKEVALATSEWREVAKKAGAPRAEIDRMSSAFEHDDLNRAQKTEEFKSRMHQRNGIEGTISELVCGHGMRRARYRGLAKVDLQNQLIAAACNIKRWLEKLIKGSSPVPKYRSQVDLINFLDLLTSLNSLLTPYRFVTANYLYHY